MEAEEGSRGGQEHGGFAGCGGGNEGGGEDEEELGEDGEVERDQPERDDDEHGLVQDVEAVDLVAGSLDPRAFPREQVGCPGGDGEEPCPGCDTGGCPEREVAG